ncbi:MAG: NAD-dependent epimerase/dehydratase family protein [Terriglobia bacterium]
MNLTIGAEYWQRLRSEARLFPWRDALLRMAADFLLVNASMILAFVLWFFFYALVRQVPQPEILAENFKNFVVNYWLFWSFLALLAFHLNGFYTRTRGYASRYKAWVVFQAVSLFVVLFVFADYLFFRGALVPRGVAVLGWGLTLATVGGSRFAKAVFLERYRVEPKLRRDKVERVLVLGGAGYLGSVLVPQLLVRGYKTRVFDSFLYGDKSLGAVKNNPNCELVSGDIRDIQAVVQAMKDCGAAIHLAAIVGDPACEGNRQLAIETNRAATRMRNDVARGYGIRRLLFASDFLMDEHTKLAPLTIYAQTKADSETILLAARSLDFRPTVLRLGTLFGFSPRPRFDLVVNLLVARAATAGKITIFNGEQWRPFVHVKDAARAFVTCLEANADVVSGEIFNVGAYPLNHQLAEIGETIARIVPGVQVQQVENEDRRNYRVSFDKIHTRLGFVCEKTLADGIREIYEWIRNGPIKDYADEEFSNQLSLRDSAPPEKQLEQTMNLLENQGAFE